MADTKKPAEKKPAADVNKSEEIRKIATAMKAKGIEVSSPQVSMVLKKMGFRPRKRRKTVNLAAAAAAANKTGKSKAKISVEDLVAAKKAVGRLGGLDRALAAIEALRQFDT
jgi:hypothetical protein